MKTKTDPHCTTHEKKAPPEERLPKIRSFTERVESGELELVAVDETATNSEGTRLMIVSYRKASR